MSLFHNTTSYFISDLVNSHSTFSFPWTEIENIPGQEPRDVIVHNKENKNEQKKPPRFAKASLPNSKMICN